jgi:hypothetical protein
MTRSDFINKTEVNLFIDYFADKIFGILKHKYTIRKTKQIWCCDNIFDAATKYLWPWCGLNNTLKDSIVKLDHFQYDLNTALENKDAAQLRDISIDIFKWGGVSNGNTKRVRKNYLDLASNYEGTISELHLNGNDQVLKKVWNMNAGLSKIYSLLSDDLIIYDSRVGAALGYLVRQCAIQHGWQYIPQELLFPYAPPRKNRNAVHPVNRDPGSFKGVRFPTFNGRSALHSIFMLRASWVIDAVIKKLDNINPDALKYGNVKSLRRHRLIEAGLFMIGYDLPYNKEANNG